MTAVAAAQQSRAASRGRRPSWRSVYQGVTLGARSFRRDGEWALVQGEWRHPILHDDVQVFSGAAVLGRVTIGRGARIGAGVVVVDDVAPGARVTALPARQSGYYDGAGI